MTYDFRHVKNDDGGFEADTNTSNETTNHNSREGIAFASDHLNDNTDHVDTAAKNNSPLATHVVGKITSNESAKEGTAGQNRDDERGVAFGKRILTRIDHVDEDLGAVDTVDVTRIVTEEDATERGESAEKVGLPGDGSLDVLDIVSRVEGDGALALLILEGCAHCCDGYGVVDVVIQE